ncbi:hypothetical protein MKZ38_004033 [Zalerion maritima]|uniref:Intradiol ring-cleavage dioxygenases domain-containing protein n=1 Tax=Zalerion maritima TaxID=339359 RepID=A0AAD5RLZ2_9PEZI|nr:hypothetical protein MKZ38_004033 [Zalerion maritima]
MRFANFLAGAIAGANIAAAHPGHDHSQEQVQRREFFGARGRRDLSHCADKLRARGVEARNVKRRAELVKSAALKRGLKPRDLEDYIDVDHESTEDYDLSTDPSTLFSGNNSCVLSPEVTEGPYYVSGEYIRTNINDDQSGVDMTVDTQVIDVNTCEPVADAYVEIWHCNSTGVYSGVVASGNGVGDSDPSNLDNTFHRGVQLTDEDGVVNFETMFPGHYTGRTTHIHVMVHLNAEAQANGTLIDTTAAHVGQMFFDQSLISEVETTSPYSTNTQSLLTNEEDGILGEEAATSDPFMEYVLLGDSVEDGLLAWLAFGIDTSYSGEVSAAATLTEDGGVANEGSGSGGPGGAGGPPRQHEARRIYWGFAPRISSRLVYLSLNLDLVERQGKFEHPQLLNEDDSATSSCGHPFTEASYYVSQDFKNAAVHKKATSHIKNKYKTQDYLKAGRGKLRSSMENTTQEEKVREEDLSDFSDKVKGPHQTSSRSPYGMVQKPY